MPGGELTWLSSLGPGEIGALALGLVAIGLSIPRWVVRAMMQREQQISGEYRTAYLTEVARGDRATEIVQQQTEIVRQLATAVQRLEAELNQRQPAATGRHHRGDG